MQSHIETDREREEKQNGRRDMMEQKIGECEKVREKKRKEKKTNLKCVNLKEFERSKERGGNA